MLFSSIFFLFFFLPTVLPAYFFCGPSLRNFLLFVFSLFFYAWGEGFYVFLMIGSVIVNYFFGLLIYRKQEGKSKKNLLFLAVICNLSPLIYFKYSEFFLSIVDDCFAVLHISAIEFPQPVHLPLGISFFTFQALSYVIDVYRKDTKPQKNILDLGLYVALFPQLIAGPIVRYHDIVRQIRDRALSINQFAIGVERFVFGLSKKTLLANPLGEVADAVFVLPGDSLTISTAWAGIICYTLQIYFDFSGYSDMAIGLGKMFGFDFLENFNYPYFSRSVREFWRRWHISLSTWFKDYLYIPLGGNRCGKARMYLNLLLVFFLCGLWHGASWTFVAWGLLHGLFIIFEHGKFGRWLTLRHPLIRHFYVILFLCNTWVFFRVDSISQAVNYLKVMYTFGPSYKFYPLTALYFDLHFFCVLIAGLILSMPVYSVFFQSIYPLRNRVSATAKLSHYFGSSCRICTLGTLFLFSIMSMAVGSYNPFIYFRF